MHVTLGLLSFQKDSHLWGREDENRRLLYGGTVHGHGPNRDDQRLCECGWTRQRQKPEALKRLRMSVGPGGQS